MSETSLKDLYKQAQEEGATSGLFPDMDDTEFEITKAKHGPAQGGDSTNVGWYCKVVSGPNAGKCGWMNQNIGAKNPVGSGIFFGILDKFGLDQDFYLNEAVKLDAILEATIGVHFTASTSAKTKGKYTNQIWRNITKVTSVNDAAPAAPAAVPAAPTPSAQPVSVPPAAEPAPAAEVPAAAEGAANQAKPSF